MPDGKIQCYVDSKSPKEKEKALLQAGFKSEAHIKNQFAWNGDWYDVKIYSRFSN